MEFIYYTKCSTCKKARKFLEENNIEFEDREINEINPTYEELITWFNKSSQPIKKFINTTGIMYKEQNLKDRLKTLSNDKIMKLLSSNGMLVKRPILVLDDESVLLGFNEAQWKEKLNIS